MQKTAKMLAIVAGLGVIGAAYLVLREYGASPGATPAPSFLQNTVAKRESASTDLQPQLQKPMPARSSHDAHLASDVLALTRTVQDLQRQVGRLGEQVAVLLDATQSQEAKIARRDEQLDLVAPEDASLQADER